MTRSDLIDALSRMYPGLSAPHLEGAVRCLFDAMVQALVKQRRIEVRGFGSFGVRYRAPRMARNPRNGATIEVAGRFSVFFKPGQSLKGRLIEAGDTVLKV